MLTLGSALVAGAILLTALVALLFRRPKPPGWSRPDLVAMLVAVPLAGAMALGLGYMLTGAYRLTGALDLYDLAGTIAVWVAAAVAWRALGVRARLKAYAAADRAAVIAHPDVADPNGSPAALPAQAADLSHPRAA